MAARPLPCHPAFLGCPGLAGLPAVPSWGGRPQGQRRLCRRDRGPPRGVPAGRTAAGRARARLCRWGSSLRPDPQRFCGGRRWFGRLLGASGREAVCAWKAPPRPAVWFLAPQRRLAGAARAPPCCVGGAAAPCSVLLAPGQPVVCPLLFSSVLSASGCRGASWEFGGASQSF